MTSDSNCEDLTQETSTHSYFCVASARFGKLRKPAAVGRAIKIAGAKQSGTLL